MRDLSKRVAVVTGAGSGIGRGISQAFAAAGAKLALADINAEALEETQSSLGSSVESILVPTDVAEQTHLDELAERTLDTFGAVHILCNNAGVGCHDFIWEYSLEDWDWVMNVNVGGVIHGLRSFVPIFLRQDDDAYIVNTSSMLGLSSVAMMGTYVASKHAVLAISEVLRADLQMKNARVGVSVLCPGPVRTNFYDQPGRPAVDASSLAPEASAMHDAMKRVVAAGMDPREVGQSVIEAIRAERFWVLPAPEFANGLQARVDEILEAVEGAEGGGE